jgi:predicted Kef-type K+ transport protein
MGFSGVRALIMVAVLIALVVAVTKFGLPGWLLPVGLVLSGMVLKNSEQRASS